MSDHVKKILFFIPIFIITFTVTAFSQDPPASDTLFNEIILSDGQVSAVDTSGNDWYYDFDNDRFVRGLMPDEGRIANGNNIRMEELPVEERCVNEKKVKQFTSYVTVGIDEYVDGDIIASGRVTIKGWVKGNVTSLNNRVLVASTGQVDGDIKAEKIIVRDGGVVLGVQNENPLSLPEFQTGVSGIVAIIVIMIFLAICIFLILALMPQKFDVFSDCMMHNKLKMTLLGFLFYILMPVLFLLVIITIIGIVFTPFILLLYLFASIFGLSAFCNGIGRFFTKKIFGKEKSKYMQVLIGFFLFAVIWILAISFMSVPEESDSFGFGVFLLNIAIILSIVPYFGGIGTAVITRFGFRPYSKKGPDQMRDNLNPSPPPIPNAPEIKPPPSSGPYRSDEH